MELGSTIKRLRKERKLTTHWKTRKRLRIACLFSSN